VLTFSLYSDAHILNFFRCFVPSIQMQNTILQVLFPHSYLDTKHSLVYLPSLWVTFNQLCSMFINTPCMLFLSVCFILSVIRLLERTHWINYESELRETLIGQQSNVSAPSIAPVSSSQRGNRGNEDRQDGTRSHSNSPRFHSETTTVSKLWTIADHYERWCTIHDSIIRTFYLGNHYGLFANMTKIRCELIVEISANQQQWYEISFRSKPDKIDEIPGKNRQDFWHMPRLDWLLWFVALRSTGPAAVLLLPKWFWTMLLMIVEYNPQLSQLPQDVSDAQQQELLSSFFPETTISLIKQIKLEALKMKHHRKQHQRTWTNVTLPSVEPDTTDYQREDHIEEELDDVFVRVSLYQYDFAIQNKDTSSKVSNIYWKRSLIKLLIPSAQISHIHQVCDKHSSHQASLSPKSNSLNTTSRPPTVETAQEIIMRTLMKNLKKVRDEQQQQYPSSSLQEDENENKGKTDQSEDIYSKKKN
jgi:hypothetical protein